MGIWTDIEIAGHACETYEPAHLSEHNQAVLYLHDRQQSSLRENRAFLDEFERHGLRVLCPLTGESWWADRIHEPFDTVQTAERFVLDACVPWLAEHWQVVPPQIALFGCEMGGQGALRISYKHPNVFPVVAAIAPALDFQIHIELSHGRLGDPALTKMYGEVESGRQDTATLHIHPLNWPRNQWFCADPGDYYWHDSAERLRMKLYSLGVPYEGEFDITAEATGWSYHNKMAAPAMAFLAERLEAERRRVV
ncbi:alpha/beta hydrolase-fold protein [Adhaeretor mobilis]|uniref:Esterase n=1 Tax=Adhaeretor mobilis TaxID=1930276 RepID=A0A517N397_9BACT|nr:alpha/beta hydrolase-fold protein [Adhaeretor mobilis]QDT01604.1 Putative esterase [Adhaeretor mobilis]